MLVGSSEWEEAWSVIQTSSGGYAFAGVQIQFLDTTAYHHYVVKISGGPPAGVKDLQVAPRQFYLFQNYPNPFNPATKIKYSIPNSEKVLIKVYDVLGEEVKILFDEHKDAGTYEIEFDGSELASGLYFYKITSGNFSEVRKMMLLR